MANEYDYEGGGSGFIMGLLTGTVLGAGLGMLFAPKSGSELRGQISDTATRVGSAASENYQKVADKAGNLAERGRGVMGRARDAVSRGAEEAKRYTSSEPRSQATGDPGASPAVPGSPYSAGPDRS